MTFRTLRKSIGFSVNQCADWLGVSERAVRNWETGKYDVPRSVMLAMGYRNKHGELDPGE